MLSIECEWMRSKATEDKLEHGVLQKAQAAVNLWGALQQAAGLMACWTPRMQTTGGH